VPASVSGSPPHAANTSSAASDKEMRMRILLFLTGERSLHVAFLVG
jgi:hypothetical protein